jgi:hypothetical protein
MVVRGMPVLVLALLSMVIWKCFSGREQTTVHGIGEQGRHFEVLKWAVTNKCPRNEGICTNAADNGDLAMLQWARSMKCPWGPDTCALAAFGGHLQVLQWARANGGKWAEDTCASAAEGGHLEVLQWARANGCEWDEDTCALAAKAQHWAKTAKSFDSYSNEFVTDCTHKPWDPYTTSKGCHFNKA